MSDRLERRYERLLALFPAALWVPKTHPGF